MSSKIIFVLIYIVLLLLFTHCKSPDTANTCSNFELQELIKQVSKSKSLEEFILPESSDFANIPQDTSNPISVQKIKLGQFLFFDPAISFNPKCNPAAGTFSCATCHFAEAGFQAGIRQSIAGGGRGFGFNRQKHPLCDSSEMDVQMIRTPSIVNCAYQEVQLWSGKFGATGPNFGTDSLWPKGSFVELNRLGMQGVETQARVALEAHGMRMSPKLVSETEYQALFDSAFIGTDANLKYRRISMAKAIAAYERIVLTNKAPFQYWLRGDTNTLTAQQVNGAAVFFGKGKCVQCHNGPALNSMNFYALGMNDMEGKDVVQKDSINDNPLGRGAFTKKEDDMYCFKVPQLYNLKDVHFLGHGGNFSNVREVIEYKNKAISQNIKVPQKQISNLFVELKLTVKEINALTDFIENALHDPDLKRYQPTYVPSGFCFPNNDKLSKEQMNCNAKQKIFE